MIIVGNRKRMKNIRDVLDIADLLSLLQKKKVFSASTLNNF